MLLVKTLLDDPDFITFFGTAHADSADSLDDGKGEILKNGGLRHVFYDGERWPQWRYSRIDHGKNPISSHEIVEENASTVPSVWTPVIQISLSAYTTGDNDQVNRMAALLRKSLPSFFSFQSPGSSRHVIIEDDVRYIEYMARTDPFRIDGYRNIQILSSQQPNIYVRSNIHICALR